MRFGVFSTIGSMTGDAALPSFAPLERYRLTTAVSCRPGTVALGPWPALREPAPAKVFLLPSPSSGGAGGTLCRESPARITQRGDPLTTVTLHRHGPDPVPATASAIWS